MALLQAIEQGFERVVATDNNAAALMATSKNGSNNKLIGMWWLPMPAIRFTRALTPSL